jgi:hypothetical protein
MLVRSFIATINWPNLRRAYGGLGLDGSNDPEWVSIGWDTLS